MEARIPNKLVEEDMTPSSNCSDATELEKRRGKKTVALVRERTIPTKLPPLVGQVSANLCG
jgi:hypothetical protein